MDMSRPFCSDASPDEARLPASFAMCASCSQTAGFDSWYALRVRDMRSIINWEINRYQGLIQSKTRSVS